MFYAGYDKQIDAGILPRSPDDNAHDKADTLYKPLRKGRLGVGTIILKNIGITSREQADCRHVRASFDSPHMEDRPCN